MAPRGMHSACLGPTSIWFSVHSPGQHAVDTIDRLLVVIVAMRWRRQALRSRNRELKGRDAAGRAIPSEKEAYCERSDTDVLLGRIDM